MSQLFNKIKDGGVYVIAEMSANHAGKKENALELIKKAKEAGADCIKIQTYTADTMTIDCDKEAFLIQGGLWDGYKLYDLYKEAYTPWEWQQELKEAAEEIGLDFLSTPFDNTSVDFLESIGVDAYKIASFELVDIPLIEYTAAKGKPMIISCGMASKEEIQDALSACRRAGNEQIVLLKCCSEYPANWKDMHLANIPDMKSQFGVPIGLSDHSAGYIAAIVGVSMGACVLEKHMCLSKDIPNPDVAFSMEPEEFKEMVQAVNDSVAIIGQVQYGPTPKEVDSLQFRRSLYAVKDIKAGELFSEENVRSIRPSNGLKPKYYSDLLGKASKRDIAFGQAIESGDL